MSQDVKFWYIKTNICIHQRYDTCDTHVHINKDTILIYIYASYIYSIYIYYMHIVYLYYIHILNIYYIYIHIVDMKHTYT